MSEAHRILFIDHATALGGAERSLLLLMRYLNRQRYMPLLACNEGPLAEAARRMGIRVYPVPMPRLRGTFAALPRLLKGTSVLLRIIHQEGVDIVHSNVMRASFYAALAAYLSRRPLVWHVRDIHTERWYLRLMCCTADAVIAISEAVAASIPCEDKTRVIYNGLDLADFSPIPDGRSFRTEWGISLEVPLIGVVGRLQPWKGQHLFLRAAAQVTKRYPAVCFLVVGGAIFGDESGYRQRLENLVDELNLRGKVIFAGQREDLLRVLGAMDILVHCSRAEPFGRVLIEGMAAGLPIVAFADGGVPEIVIHGETGLLVPPGDVGALARGISELLADPQRRRQMGAAGRERVARCFDIRQTTREVERVYDALLREGEDAHRG